MHTSRNCLIVYGLLLLNNFACCDGGIFLGSGDFKESSRGGALLVNIAVYLEGAAPSIFVY